MRQAFLRLSIKGKLIAIIMLVSVAGLSVTASLFLLYETAMYRDGVSREMETVAQITAGSSSAAVVFGDARAARETLSVLRGQPHIASAALYTRSGAVLGFFHTASGAARAPDSPGDPRFEFSGGRAVLVRAVLLDGESVGMLYLERELGDMWSRLRQYLWMLAAVLLLSVLVSLLVSSALQGLISRPILRLAETAEMVRLRGDYSIRARRESGDELGLLVERFNEMMERVGQRDEELERSQNELETRVVARTIELQREIERRERIQEDLLAAKQTAEDSSRAKSAFLANMSHELRTPLNAIIGYSEMLEEEAASAGSTACAADLRKIQTAGRHLLALINDVLDLSKIEAGRMEIRKEWIRVSDLVAEAANTAAPLARKNNNRLEVRRLWPGDAVYTDALKFRQSLLNLLSNACKFTENGEVTLEIDRDSRNGKDWVLWRVRDTGIGIPPEDVSRLFRSFSQLDSSSTRRFGGTGLGLAISQRLCRMMGGDIEVSSRPGQGSEFTIRLEAAAGTQEDA